MKKNKRKWQLKLYTTILHLIWLTLSNKLTYNAFELKFTLAIPAILALLAQSSTC